MSGGRGLLVTGATGRLGEATVRALLERGDRLLLTGRDQARLGELAAVFGDSGVGTLNVDVSGPEGAQHAAAEAARTLGGLDGLVHLVGAFDVGPVMLTDAAAYEELLRANFLSAVTATQAVLPHLREGGRLVYFGTPLADEPLGGMSAYAASKAALVTWVRSMSHEVKNRGIHANAISLTLVETPEMRKEMPNVDPGLTVDAELVARAVRFLTGPDSDGMYGSVVPVVGRFGFTSALAGGPPAGGPPSGGPPSGGPPSGGPPPGVRPGGGPGGGPGR
ncbi:SDR family oxidoreductase [Streptomyces sp. CAI-121]|uniref:SDR family oxidoreductase n=1 Tax=unclassified Streptomyces TaxID=2593676 RepID=UPI001587189E|nr:MULTISPECIES: SDR family oxidoreductase [unclassified Streptomyces]NUV67214.1 SDR family oxidoreductase [Streptomyces sp. CAI-121]NUW13332.1 SDR family oxidoreductase [Streptomyces sp. CAI-68]